MQWRWPEETSRLRFATSAGLVTKDRYELQLTVIVAATVSIKFDREGGTIVVFEMPTQVLVNRNQDKRQ